MQNNNDQKCFSWLHFSDLQLSTKVDGLDRHGWASLKKDLEVISLESSPWNAIFITGDLAFSGQTNEYEQVTNFLDELLFHLKKLGSQPVIIPVPGNHDVDRSFSQDQYASRIFRFWLEDADLRRDFWKRDKTLIDLLTGAFKNYSDWLQFTTLPLPKKRKKGVIPGDFSLTLQSKGLRVGIVGLNSAFTQLTTGNSLENVILDQRQLKEVCGNNIDAWAEKHHFNILLTHHSPDSFDPEVQSVFKTEFSPPGRFALHMCGSSHGGATIKSDLGSGILLQSASRNLRENSLLSYLTGSLILGGGKSNLVVRSRRYNSRNGKWIEDGNNDEDLSSRYLSSFFRSNPHSGRKIRRAKVDVVRDRIDNVEIKNFRSFKSIFLDLNHNSKLPGDWTCLAGINGAGKSSILQAICLSFLGQPSILELGGERLERMNHIDGGTSHGAQIKAYFTQGGKQHFVDLRLTELLGNNKVNSSQIMLDVWRSLKSLVCVAYGATRNISDYQDNRHSSLSTEVRRVITLFDPLSQIASAEVLLAEHDAPDSPLLKLFENLLKEIFGDTLGVQLANRKIMFIFEGEPVSAIDLPDGFRSTVAWLVDLCIAWIEKFPVEAQKAKVSDIKALVLIDEIDLHLHPSMQRLIIPRLRAALPNVQWIVTTHSPLILSSFDSTEIIALDRNEIGGTRNLDRQILGFTTDQIYEWLMGTPPTSSAVEQKISEVDLSSEKKVKDVAELLELSPTVDQAEAAEIVQKRQELLKRLESLKKI